MRGRSVVDTVAAIVLSPVLLLYRLITSNYLIYGFIGAVALAVGLAALGQIGAIDTPSGPAAEDDSFDAALAEHLIHQEVNERRAQRGIAELHYHEGLADDARRHSEDMDQRDFYGHENPDGEGPQERTTTRCRVGENINGVYWETEYEAPDGDVVTIDSEEELAEQVADEWMNSPGHRENVLDERYASEGIGAAIDQESGEVFVTQMFCF